LDSDLGRTRRRILDGTGAILDWKVKVLRKIAIGLVKVQWTYYIPKCAMWEHKDTMQEEYLQILVNFEENEI
jgi:hypothetical protein